MSGAETQTPTREFGVPPFVWKAGVALYLMFMFGLAAVYLTVAAQGIEYAITVSGDARVCVGQPAALRVGVRDLQMGRYLARAPLSLHLRRGDRDARVFTGFTSAAGLADVNVDVPPDWQTGEADWEVRVPTPEGNTEIAIVPLELVACDNQRPEVAPEGDDDTKVDSAGTGPLKIDLVAEGGTLVDGLESTLFVRVTDRADGTPVRTTVAVKLVKGLVDGSFRPSLRTDQGGLGALQVTPVGNQRWRFSVDGDGTQSVRELILKSRPTQHVLHLPSPVWRADEDLRVTVRSLRRTGEIYGDLYGPSSAWAYGVVGGVGVRGGSFTIPTRAAVAPREGISILHVQAYADPLAPGGAGDMRYVVLPAARMTDKQVLERLLGRAQEAGSVHTLEARALAASPWLGQASESAMKRHIAYWLSLGPRTFVQPTVLMDTKRGQEDEMARDKDGAREAITWLLAISGAVGLLVVLWLVLGNYLEVRRAGRFAAAELDLDMDGLHRAMAIVQLVFLFATIVIFFASIVALLRLL